MELSVTIFHGFQGVAVAKSYLIAGAGAMDYNMTNNIKGMQNKNKRLSIIEYFKNKIGNNGILFLQETHSTTSDEEKWKDESVNLFLIHTVLLTLVVH